MESEDQRHDISQSKSDAVVLKSFLNSSLDQSVEASFSLPVTRDEASSQTDPVTIIIGDASFLVQKLKSSAVNSSKVCGNFLWQVLSILIFSCFPLILLILLTIFHYMYIFNK